MSTSRKKKALRRLTSALDRKTPVAIARKHLYWDETVGFVIALTNDWVVLHTLDGAYLDGVTLLRLDLVTRVGADPDEAYVMRATDGLGVPLTSFECEPDATVAELLEVASTRGEIIGVLLESRDGNWMNYGKIHHIGKHRVDLQYIGRGGDWMDFIDAWKLSGITRIEFGGRYIRALELFGNPRPEALSRKKR